MQFVCQHNTRVLNLSVPLPSMAQTHHAEQKVILLSVTATACGLLLLHKLYQRHQQDHVQHKQPATRSWLPHVLQLTQRAASPPLQQHQHQEQQPVVYDYAQSIEEVLVEARLPAHIQPQDVQVKISNSSLLVVVGEQRVIDGLLAGPILSQHSSWKIEGQGKSRKLSITLCKQPVAAAAAAPAGAAAAATVTPTQYAVWSSLLVSGDAQKSPDRKRDQDMATK